MLFFKQIIDNLKKLREEKEFLENQLMEIKDGAIDAIVEREKQIIELNYKCQDIEEECKAQIEVLVCEKNILNEKISKLEHNLESKVNYEMITNLEVKKKLIFDYF